MSGIVQEQAMPTLKILCTRKTSDLEPPLRISHVGGANNSGLPWTLTVEEAIRTIELRQYNFIVVREGRRTEVQVVQGADGAKSLRCACDAAGADTLSSLPDCP
jgi:hypothetical protein